MAGRVTLEAPLDDLRSLAHFAQLDDEALAALGRATVSRPFAPGQLLFLEGERAPAVWYVRGGRVRIFKLARDGREQVLCVAQARSCAGCPLFFGGTNPASAEALDHGTISFLPAAAVEPLLERYPQIGLALLRVLAERERALVGVATTLVMRCVGARLAQILLAEARSAPGMAIRMTHADLARHAGLAREVVSRALSRWSRDGVLSCHRGLIVIHEPSALERYLGGRTAMMTSITDTEASAP